MAPMAMYTTCAAKAQPGRSMAPVNSTANTDRVRLMGPMAMLKGATTAVRAAHRAARTKSWVLVFFMFVSPLKKYKK